VNATQGVTHNRLAGDRGTIADDDVQRKMCASVFMMVPYSEAFQWLRCLVATVQYR